jgi:hypothetical protein
MRFCGEVFEFEDVTTIGVIAVGVEFLPVRVKGTQRGNEIHHRLVFSTTAVLGFEVSL